MSNHNHTLSSQTQLECQRMQQDQFDILSYIYLDQFHIVKQTHPHKFSILIRPYLHKLQFEYQLSLHFEFTKTYPRTPLKYDIQPITGITRDNLNQINTKIQDIIYQNRDKPLVYDIVQEIRLWIVQYLVQGKAYQSQQQVVKKVQEVFQRPKFAAFTPVTVQSFLAWKKQFEARHQKPVKKQGQVKLTGKQWFLGKKDQEIEESEEQLDSDVDDEIQEQEEDNGPKRYDQPENKLFMMDEEQTQVQKN